MLRYLRSTELAFYPRLAHSMFRDRADQFRNRLGWSVTVDANGEERDQYDRLDPLYVIWENADGTHGGSMRFLPTTGRTMLAEHFADLLNGQTVCDPDTWECTRFCLSRNAAPAVSTALMLGGAEVGVGFGLRRSVGVFDARMTRIYARLGWTPEIFGSTGEGRDRISAGFWTFSEAVADDLARRADIPRAMSRVWFHRARAMAPADAPVALRA